MKILCYGVTVFWFGVLLAMTTTIPDLVRNTKAQAETMREFDQ